MVKYMLIGLLLALGIYNIGTYLKSLGIIIEVYHFESLDGQFTFISVPAKGKTVEGMERILSKMDNPPKVYRKHAINYLKLWKYPEYCTHPRWRYPYYRHPIRLAKK